MSTVYQTPARSDRRCRYQWFDAWDWLVNAAIRLVDAPLPPIPAGFVAIDPHVHTLFSRCSISQPERIIMRAVRMGLGGIAVMDHNDPAGALDAMRCAEDLKGRGIVSEDFLVIPGVEITSSAGHIGALFVREPLTMSLSPAETVREIQAAGGIAVAVHPFHSSGVGEAVFDVPFDAVETDCGNVFSRETAKRMNGLSHDPRLAGLAKLGSSDSHYLNAVGSCYTLLPLETPSLESARQSMLNATSQAFVSPQYLRLRKLLGGISRLR